MKNFGSEGCNAAIGSQCMECEIKIDEADRSLKQGLHVRTGAMYQSAVARQI